MHALETLGLAKTYGDLIALEPLDLVVPEGQRVVIVGSQTAPVRRLLLGMAAGLLDPSAGEGTGPRSPGRNARGLGPQVSYLSDNPVLYDDLSVLEHLEYVCRLHDADDWQERGVGLLAEMGLSERADDLPSRFSRGLRQKTAIILGLIRPFSLLLVDEPFVGLDPPGRAAFIDLLADASESGATVIVATHQLDYVQRSDRVIALRDGVVVYDGPPDQVDVSVLAS